MKSIDLLSRYALEQMTEAHLDEVLGIERLSSSHPWSREAFRRDLEANGFSRPRVATTRHSASRVVGYCVVWIVFDHVQIQNVGVHPDFRRQGVAKMLLHRALEDGAISGATSAQLEVRASNVAAQSLYTSIGFTVAGTRKDYYSQPREDAVLMHKALA